MSRLIDADAFSAEIKKRQDACKKWMENSTDEMHLRACGAYPVFCETKLLLDQMPTIDAVEVVHGEWIMFERPNGGYYKGCSLCTYPMPTDMELDYLCEEDNRYCYNCGAKMIGDEDEQKN